MFVKDTMSGATAGTDLNTHTGEIGATWTKHPSIPTSTMLFTSAGRVYGSTAVIDNLYYASGVPASADYSVFADLTIISLAGAAGVCGRLNTGAVTYYRAVIDATFIYLQKFVAGSATTISSAAHGLNEGLTYRIGLHMSGTNLKVTVDGAVTLTGSDASIAAAGRAGIISAVASSTTGIHIDNVIGSNAIFWVGGNGSIGSSGHWSRLPAGSSGITPSSTDDAYIDQNSGSPTVTADSSITLSSLSFGTHKQYTDTTKTMTITGTGSNSLTITGDLTIYGNAAFGSGLANMILSGTTDWYQYSSSYIPQITISSTGAVVCGHSPLGIIQCNATVMTYTGTGSLTLPLLDPNVSDKYASLNVGTFDLTLANASSDVIFGSSTIGSEMHVSQKLDLNGSAPLTNLSKLVVYFDGDSTIANLGSKTLASIHVDSGKCTMTGANVANSLILERGVGISMDDSCTFGYIALSSYVSIVIASGKTLTGRLIIQNYNETAHDVSISSSTPGSRGTWNMNNGGQIVKSRWRVRDIAFTNGSIVAYHSINDGNNLGISFITGFQKTYRYAVYDFAGNYVGEYTDVVSDPEFLKQINSIPGQMTIRREVDPLNYGEGTLVDYDNKVVVTCFSDDNPNGIIIYTGAIESWTPNIEAGNSYVDIIVMPYGADMAQFPVTDVSSFDVSIQQALPKTLLSFSSSKLAVSWTTGSGVVLLGYIFSAAIKYANTSSVTVSIYKDNGTNTPDNTVAVYSSTYDTENTSIPQDVPLPVLNISVSALSKYWLVVDTHGGSMSSSLVYTSNDYANGNAAYWNGSAWVQSSSYGIDSFYTLTTNADTSISFFTDLKSALVEVMTTYNSLGGRINFSDASIEDPGVLFIYDFNSNTMLDAIQKFVDQCPAGWFWYVDPATNLLHLHPPHTQLDHRFTLGIDVEKVQLQKTKSSIVNNLYITGGDTGGGVNLFRNYVNLPSISRYRRRTKFYSDINLVDEDAADAIGQKIIGQSKDPTAKAPLTVLSAPDIGANIEILRPGDLFVILGKDDALTYLQIATISYSPSHAEIDASTAPPQINATLNDTQVAIKQQQVFNNPPTATIVEVV